MGTVKWNINEVCQAIQVTLDAEKHAQDWDGNSEPSLIVVKDEGIYLLSSKSYEGDKNASQSGEVWYAIGYKPTTRNQDTLWDKCQDIAGGDDFGEWIALKDITPTLERVKILVDGKIDWAQVLKYLGAKFFVTFKGDRFSFGWKNS